MNALQAYRTGATGAGVLIGVVDSGIDLDSPEFGGRIAASRDVGGNRTPQDENGHGTAVAFIAAGRRNGVGTSGVAFDATLAVFRADTPGSCGVDPTGAPCRFTTDAIANGLDAARVAGARVINLSLESASVPQGLVDAVDRATAAGIVVVIAAGNDGAADPNALAAIAGTAAARNQIIIAGSVDPSDVIGATSNRAGSSIAHYLAAVGEQVRAPDENGNAWLWSGTSFAAPQIAGAVALLAQAFPNLTGAQIVDLLLRTARDAGVSGADAIYGQGIVDLTRAFAPVGSMSIAGTRTAVSPGQTGTLSAPMGDARQASVGAIVLDEYRRAYTMNVAAALSRPLAMPVLAGLAAPAPRQLGFATGGMTLALTLTDRLTQTPGPAHPLLPTGLPPGATAVPRMSGMVAQRFGATSVALGVSQGATALTAQLAGRGGSDFLLADQGAGLGLVGRPTASIGVGTRWRGLDWSVAVERGEAMTDDPTAPAARDARLRSPYQKVQAMADRRLGALTTGLAATWLDERATVLGARLGPALGAPGARSLFLDGHARLSWGGGWSMEGTWRRGWTRAAITNGLNGSGALHLGAFSAELGKDGVLGGDSLGLHIGQPLRVASGGLDLVLPTGWDYATGRVAAWSRQRVNLAPEGRELDIEARYARPLGWGTIQGSLYWRRDPGNVAALADDRGIALRWGSHF